MLLGKRKLERFQLQLKATARIHAAGQHEDSEDFTTRDISSGGAFLLTETPWAHGTMIHLDIFVPPRSKDHSAQPRSLISLCGTVIRTESHGMAICFEKGYQIFPSVENFDN